MFTLRGAVTGAITSLLLSTALVGTAQVAGAALPPPTAPYTAFTMNFSGWGYIDGSFSYEPSRNTLEVYQQTPTATRCSCAGSVMGGGTTST
jgi:hypothetical protein